MLCFADVYYVLRPRMVVSVLNMYGHFSHHHSLTVQCNNYLHSIYIVLGKVIKILKHIVGINFRDS
jgi:hypothetical protein